MERQIRQHFCNVIHMNKSIIRTYTRTFERLSDRLLERFWKRLSGRVYTDRTIISLETRPINNRPGFEAKRLSERTQQRTRTYTRTFVRLRYCWKFETGVRRPR